MGPRRTELMQLKKLLTELYDQNLSFCNNGEMGRFGKARDRQGIALRKASERHQKAADGLRGASQELDKAVDIDRKATTAYLNNTDKDAESWLEDELESAAKITRAKSAQHRAAKAELEEAKKLLDQEKAEMDKFDAKDEENFAQVQKMQKEREQVEARIAALEKDLKDNPSLGRKVKNLLK